MDRFERSMTAGATAQELFSWHLRPGAFERLVPPRDGTRVVSRSGRIEDDDMLVVLSVPVLGPIRQQWRIRHEGFEAGHRFFDVLERGPFRSWRHEHRVEPVSEHESVLIDSIEFTLPLGPLGRLLGGRLTRRRLTSMFDYRHSVTRDDLAAHAGAGLPRLTLQLVATADADPELVRQLAAFLSTGGHVLIGDVPLLGHEPPVDAAPSATLRVDAAGVEIVGGPADGMRAPLTGDVVADPRGVVAALAGVGITPWQQVWSAQPRIDGAGR